MKASKRSRNGHKPKEKTTSVSLLEYLSKLQPQKRGYFNSAMEARMLDFQLLYGKEPDLAEFQNMIMLCVAEIKQGHWRGPECKNEIRQVSFDELNF